jgi:hypothetical protein
VSPVTCGCWQAHKLVSCSLFLYVVEKNCNGHEQNNNSNSNGGLDGEAVVCHSVVGVCDRILSSNHHVVSTQLNNT